MQQQTTKRDGTHITHRIALCDGDPALQRQFEACLPNFTLILDFLALACQAQHLGLPAPSLLLVNSDADLVFTN